VTINRTLLSTLKGGSSFAALVLLSAGLLYADPITYTFTGSGTGSLGATNFTNASFTVTLTSDTSNVAVQPVLGSIPGIIGLPADIDIAGIGTENFTGTAFIFAGGVSVGFGEGNSGVPSLPGNLITVNNAALTGYGLTTGITASGTNTILSQFVNADTSGGLLTFNTMSSVTFDSSVSGVPEPSAFALLGGVVMILVLFKRRSSRSPRALLRAAALAPSSLVR